MYITLNSLGLFYFVFNFRDFWSQIQENPELIQQFVFILKNNEFDAYYFETPCVNENKLGEQVGKID